MNDFVIMLSLNNSSCSFCQDKSRSFFAVLPSYVIQRPFSSMNMFTLSIRWLPIVLLLLLFVFVCLFGKWCCFILVFTIWSLTHRFPHFILLFLFFVSIFVFNILSSFNTHNILICKYHSFPLQKSTNVDFTNYYFCLLIWFFSIAVHWNISSKLF